MLPVLFVDENSVWEYRRWHSVELLTAVCAYLSGETVELVPAHELGDYIKFMIERNAQSRKFS